MIKTYLAALKYRGNFSWSDLSKLSGLPDATIRKIFSGETADPRFETVAKLVAAMGGSLDEMAGCEPSQKSEPNLAAAVKDLYDARIEELKNSTSQHIELLKRDKRYLAIAVCVLIAFLLIALLVDIFIGTVGWVRY